MSVPRVPSGDRHNFGRSVSIRDGRVYKPRTVFWESLLLDAAGPLRTLLAAKGRDEGKGDPFAFLPSLSFRAASPAGEGDVERLDLAPVGAIEGEERRALAAIVGRAIALFAWLGVVDLHWENVVVGRDASRAFVFGPLDVEMILSDLASPVETKLLPDPDPEYAEISRHACGVRRVLPFLGKPVDPGDLVAMAAAYRATLAFLERHAKTVGDLLASLPGVREAPIRVCLRGTGEYVTGDPSTVWPPFLDAEREQMDRGDVPYFFRIYGRPGIHHYGNADLTEIRTLPERGDVPRLAPLLRPSRGLASPSRKKLRDEGTFALLGAFDHPSFGGTHAHDGFSVTFGARTIVVAPKAGRTLETRRDLRAFVGSVYLPCACGEVPDVFVPEVTRCTA